MKIVADALWWARVGGARLDGTGGSGAWPKHRLTFTKM
jgi:hypothetical protein